MVGRSFEYTFCKCIFTTRHLLVIRITFRKIITCRAKSNINKLECTQHFPMYQSWYCAILQRVMVTVLLLFYGYQAKIFFWPIPTWSFREKKIQRNSSQLNKDRWYKTLQWVCATLGLLFQSG